MLTKSFLVPDHSFSHISKPHDEISNFVVSSLDRSEMISRKNNCQAV